MLVFIMLLALGNFAKAENPLGTDGDILWTSDDLLNKGGLLPLKEDCWQTYEYFPELKYVALIFTCCGSLMINKNNNDHTS